MRVSIVTKSCANDDEFEDLINEEIKQLESINGRIVDIKFCSDCDNDGRRPFLCALILWENEDV